MILPELVDSSTQVVIKAYVDMTLCASLANVGTSKIWGSWVCLLGAIPSDDEVTFDTKADPGGCGPDDVGKLIIVDVFNIFAIWHTGCVVIFSLACVPGIGGKIGVSEVLEFASFCKSVYIFTTVIEIFILTDNTSSELVSGSVESLLNSFGGISPVGECCCTLMSRSLFICGCECSLSKAYIDSILDAILLDVVFVFSSNITWLITIPCNNVVVSDTVTNLGSSFPYHSGEIVSSFLELSIFSSLFSCIRELRFLWHISLEII